CLTLAMMVNEQTQVTTIEGLQNSLGVDIVVEAFDRSGALQCGFCQPGMILSTKDLLAHNNNPSLREIKEALSGNLCRCTGYTKIYLAVMCAALVIRGETINLEDAMAVVTKNSLHLE